MLRLSTRIGMGYGVVIAMLLLALGIGLISFEVVRSDAELLSNRLVPSVESANNLLFSLEQMENAEFMYFLSAQTRVRWFQRFDSQEQRFRREFIAVGQVADSPNHLAVVARIGQQFEAFVAIDRRIRSLISTGQLQSALRLNSNESLEEAERLRTSINQLRTIDLRAIDEAQLHELWLVGFAEVLIACAALFGVLFAGIQWRRTAYTIVEPLQALRKGTVAIGQGEFPIILHPAFATTFELLDLQQGFNRMSQRLEAITSHLEELVLKRTAALEESNRQLATALEELKAVDKLKTDLMNVVSHELLTPINFILGYGSSLEDAVLGELTEPQRHAVSRIVTGAQRLTRMVRNILDFTTMEKGKLEVHPEPLDYSKILQESLDSYRGLAEEKRQSFETSFPGSVMVLADPHRLSQVLEELLDNAVKFTPEGGRITLRVIATQEDVMTEISDTGIGIPAEKIPTLFRPFQQLDLSTTRQYGGLGMGLALVYHLLQGMGGEITLDSKLGRGTTVRFSVPRSQSSA